MDVPAFRVNPVVLLESQAEAPDPIIVHVPEPRFKVRVVEALVLKVGQVTL